MKIEKKKVSTAITATFGIAAAFTLNACDDSTSANGDAVTPDNNTPNSVESVPGSADSQGPASSAATEGAATSSPSETVPGSSQAVDIPLSHESLSSEAVEALSAVAESSSSENAAVSFADNPTSSAAAPSSSEVKPTSSETAPASSAVAPESSSDALTPSSSSHSGWDQPYSSSSVNLEEVCPDNDAWCIQVHMCENQAGCMAASMVTTFERDDITG